LSIDESGEIESDWKKKETERARFDLKSDFFLLRERTEIDWKERD
jgi:hypothetical protein